MQHECIFFYTWKSDWQTAFRGHVVSQRHCSKGQFNFCEVTIYSKSHSHRKTGWKVKGVLSQWWVWHKPGCHMFKHGQQQPLTAQFKEPGCRLKALRRRENQAGVSHSSKVFLTLEGWNTHWCVLNVKFLKTLCPRYCELLLKRFHIVCRICPWENIAYGVAGASCLRYSVRTSNVLASTELFPQIFFNNHS